MNKTGKKFSNKVGLPPGALVHIGEKKSQEVRISLIEFDKDNIEESEIQKIEDCFHCKDSKSISWINIDGLHNTEIISTIGNHFGLHSLLLEDVLNTKHRPKIEEFENCLFVALKMLRIDEKTNSINSEQISLILGKNWIISFQEQTGDVFDALRERLRSNTGSIRKKGADYLFYRLIDTVVDNYFYITEHISDKLEDLEERIFSNVDIEVLQEIQSVKKLLVKLKKSVMPLREIVSSLDKDATKLIDKSTLPYLRDVYEHVIQVNETFEIQRETISNNMDLYHSRVNDRMNKVMNVLTIIATIFIPLTFIAGIYGMNFDYMPELHLKYGYFVVWGVMIVIVIGLVIFFKKRKWL